MICDFIFASPFFEIRLEEGQARCQLERSFIFGSQVFVAMPVTMIREFIYAVRSAIRQSII